MAQQASRINLTWWRRSWATVILLPVLVAVLRAAAAAPLIHLVLGADFGLSGGQGAPWPAALAMVGLIGYWSARWLFAPGRDLGNARLASFGLWLVVTAVWLSLEPDYDVPGTPRELLFLVTDYAYLLPSIILGFVAWWQGMNWAMEPMRFRPDPLREAVRDAWVALVAGIVLAAWVGGDIGREALSSAAVAVPVAIACSIALVAAGEVVAAREVARERGGRLPGWGRWLGVSGVVAGVIVLGALLVSLVVGPDALGSVLGFALMLLRWAVLGVFWVIFAIVWAIYWVVSNIVGWLGISLPELGPQEMPEMGPMEEEPLPQENRETQPLPIEWILVLRWGAVGIALLVAALLIWRFTVARRAGDIEEDGDIWRERVFSADLAKKQLRDLFRRRGHGPRPRPLDLTHPPRTVREAYRYVTVLGAREGVARAETETATRYSARLTRTWPDTRAPIDALTTRYHRARYGDRPDAGPDLADAQSEWAEVWRLREEERQRAERQREQRGR
jgi:hypothetical protein